MNICLNDDELEALLLRSASTEQTSEWNAHLRSCDICAAALQRKQSGLGPQCEADSEAKTDAELGATVDFPRDSKTCIVTPPVEAIAGYKIIKELHRGGQGIVYQAVQRSTKRKVALKVMLEGPFAGPESQRRFEREVELIGSLRHPRIVPIFDSGDVEGWFYYAMEYIRGKTLRQHVVANKFSVQQTLQVFKKVCDAVDYAHQKGVIHRDLKPSNILVDDAGEPHVLDFGLAKVSGAEAGDDGSLLVSVTGQVMGTLSYMSPEQAAGRPDLVDLRSDVYSLGVVLYELLTGQLPYELSGQMAEKLSTIQSTEPKRPSTINRRVSNEVETIVLKAMSKNKDRRYYAAGPLGQDIQRFLDDEPIEAKRDSALYVMRKMMRRYKVPVAAAVLLFSVITTALVVSVTFWRLAETRLGETTQARNEAQAEADQNEQLLKRRRLTGYARDMYVARDAWQSANIPRMQELLQRYEVPQGADDPRSFMWHYLTALLQQLDSVPVLYSGNASLVRYSADGKLIVAEDNAVVLIDLASGQQQRLDAHESPVKHIAYSAIANQLISCDANGTIIVWDWTRRQPRFRWDVHGERQWLTAFELSPDGTRLATALANAGSNETAITVWDVADGSEFHSFVATSRVQALVSSTSSNRLVSGEWDGQLSVRDLDSGREVHLWTGHNHRIYSLALSRDGQTLISGGQGNTVKLWDMNTYELRHEFDHTGGRVNSLLLTPDGRTLIVGFRNSTVQLYDVRLSRPGLAIRERVRLKLMAHVDRGASLAVSPDGQQLALPIQGKIRTWAVDTVDQPTELRRTLIGKSGWNISLSYSSDGKMLASAGEEATVWNLTSGERIEISGHSGDVKTVAFSVDGTLLVTASHDKTVKVWDLNGHKELRRLDHEHQVWAVAIAADGTVASGGPGRTIRLWDAESDVSKRHDVGFEIMSIKYSTDGKQLIVCGGEWGAFGMIKLYHRDGLELLESREFERLPRVVYDVTFSPDGRFAASASRDRAVKLWDLSSGTLKYHLRGHTTRANSVAFSPDGKTLASSSIGPTVKLWQVSTGEEIGTFLNDDNVTCVAFSPDGKTLATLGEGGRVTLWGSSPDIPRSHRSLK